MTFLLDHLTAVLVGGTLLVALLVVQQRGQQGAAEAALRYQNQTLASSFLDTVERDVEDIRSEAEAKRAFDGSTRFSVRQETGPDGTVYTSQFAFPTLARDESEEPDTVIVVVYEVEPTGRTVLVDDVERPTYRAQRYEYRRGQPAAVAVGGSGDLLDFDVTLRRRVRKSPGPGFEDSEVTDDDTVDGTPTRVHVALVAAAPLPEQRAHDQSGATLTAASRHARTVRVANARAGGGTPPTGGGSSSGIPPLPGDD